MADYIDREELLKNMAEKIRQFDCGYQSVFELIQNAPSVDAVEVVRCKDCKHRYESTTYNHDRCRRLIMPVSNGDFFCKWGEKE